MLEALKERVFQANLALPKHGLVTFTWGNVSEIDRETGLVVIKPSGVPYEKMTEKDMVVSDLDGNVVEGELRPSSDLMTHIVLYKSFSKINGVVHTHSTYATAWAQAGKGIPCYGTTHADYFYGVIPCTVGLSEKEINSEYELNTGKVIVKTFEEQRINPFEVPGVLCENHGVFTFGKNADMAVHNAVVIEEVAKIALLTERINSNVKPINQYLLDKHYQRKHGKNAYYGQSEKN